MFSKRMLSIVFVGFVLLPTVLSAGPSALTKQYPPYPDVWGYELPSPLENRSIGLAAYKMPNGDYFFTYLSKITEKRRKGGFCCEGIYGGLSFFSGASQEFTEEQYQSFVRANTDRAVTTGLRNDVVIPQFKDLSTLFEIEENKGTRCGAQFPRSIIRSTREGKAIFKKMILYLLPEHKKQQVREVCRKDIPTEQRVENGVSEFVQLEDETIILYGDNFMIRFDKDLQTKYPHLNERIFVVESNEIDKLKTISKGEEADKLQGLVSQYLTNFKQKTQPLGK